MSEGKLIHDLLIILSAGLVAGLVCRRLGISVLVGYLAIGATIGESAFGLVSDDHHEIEYIAEAGVFFLLFSIGIEFSLDQLLKLGRNLLTGGSVQMLLVAGPVALVMLVAGLSWQASVVIGAAASFSSTVLVFKALSEWGQSGLPHGRRAIGILLFQDAALIPLLLVVPLITGTGPAAHVSDYARLAATSVLFVGAVILVRHLIAQWTIPLLARYRSPDLIVLFTLVTLGGVTLAAYSVGLPPAIGAFAAGLIFSGNRWTQQVDALIFPFRESFAAIFFVSLGLIASPELCWQEPIFVFGSLAGVVIIKAIAATVALKLTGLRWQLASGTGVGLAHIGEFAFVLALLGWEAGAIDDSQYERFVTIALLSLILTPFLIRWGLDCSRSQAHASDEQFPESRSSQTGGSAIVIGAGPTGRQVASRLEIAGHDVCVIDLSPVNLHPFAQQGFRTISGDATEHDILEHAQIENASTVILCVPADDAAIEITRNVRNANRDCLLLIRCRYHANVARLIGLGADRVVSEEAEAGQALIQILDDQIAAHPGN